DAGDNEDVEGCNSITRQLPVGSQRSLRGPSENSDGPSTTTVSNVPRLAGIEEGLVNSDQPHAPEPVGPNAPLIVPWVPSRQRRRTAFILAAHSWSHRERETIHTFSQLRSQRRRRCGYASPSSLISSNLHRCPRWRGSDGTGSISDLSQCCPTIATADLMAVQTEKRVAWSSRLSMILMYHYWAGPQQTQPMIHRHHTPPPEECCLEEARSDSSHAPTIAEHKSAPTHH
ncbi:hypothetical protein EDD18DRAFT_1162267, partial [Armillaria luteobubalina]